MQFIQIVGLCVVMCVTYGILHDQITARVCVEYFTIGHAPIFGTDDPTLLGLGWGILATWWVGVMLGIPLALAARIGRRPKLRAGALVLPIVVLMLVSAAAALLAGLMGGALAIAGHTALHGSLRASVPESKHSAFLADLWAHNASYTVGFIGGGVVILRTWLIRRKLAEANA